VVRPPTLGGAREVPRAPRARFFRRPGDRRRRARAGAGFGRRQRGARSARPSSRTHRAAPRPARSRRRVVSVGAEPALGGRHRVMTILAVALLVSVGVNWVVVETLARLGTVRHPFPGQAWLGHLVLAVGVGVVIAAGVVRRSLLAGGPADAGVRLQMASII